MASAPLSGGPACAASSAVRSTGRRKAGSTLVRVGNPTWLVPIRDPAKPRAPTSDDRRNSHPARDLAPPCKTICTFIRNVRSSGDLRTAAGHSRSGKVRPGPRPVAIHRVWPGPRSRSRSPWQGAAEAGRWRRFLHAVHQGAALQGRRRRRRRAGRAPHPDGTECHPDRWWEALTGAGPRPARARGGGRGRGAAARHGRARRPAAGHPARDALERREVRAAGGGAGRRVRRPGAVGRRGPGPCRPCRSPSPSSAGWPSTSRARRRVAPGRCCRTTG